MRAVKRGITGTLIMIIFNIFGSFTGFYMGINFFTVFISFALGIPGIIMLFLVKNIIM